MQLQIIKCKNSSACEADFELLFSKLQEVKNYVLCVFPQVGVLSWGTTNVCESTKYDSEDPPPNARDFHISIFSLMPWLREHLKQDLVFLPTDN